MKYKVGDRVKVKSLQWFKENFNDDFNVVFVNGWYFSEPMSIFCGQELIIEKISHTTNPPHYLMKDNKFAWTDEMIEGLVEEENKPKFKIGDKVILDPVPCVVTDVTWRDSLHGFVYTVRGTDFGKMVGEEHLMFNTSEEEVGLVDNLSSRLVNEFNLPDGYIFKDENGNVINATKIVLEKKKKEYPKTYEECLEILGYNIAHTIPMNHGHNGLLMMRLQWLLICRDAYWKIAGEEMGLGKPWKPDWTNEEWPDMAYISYDGKSINKENGFPCCNMILIFPFEGMRDAFKENFDPDIEFCKEFL